MEQGISEAVIDQATLINKSREHIRVNHIKGLPVKTIQAGSETGVQIPNNEVERMWKQLG